MNILLEYRIPKTMEYIGETGEIRSDCFHGTTVENALSILEEGFRLGSGLLGLGAYFDLESDETAWNMAEMKYSAQKHAVIQCEIHLGNMLDLNSQDIWQQFRVFQRGLTGRRRDIAELFIRYLELQTPGLIFHSVRKDLGKRGTILKPTIAVRYTNRIRILCITVKDGEVLWRESLNDTI